MRYARIVESNLKTNWPGHLSIIVQNTVRFSPIRYYIELIKLDTTEDITMNQLYTIVIIIQ